MLNDGFDVLDCFTINIQHGLAILLVCHELDSMANKFRHIVVVAIFPGQVGDVSYEGHISGYVPADINRSF